jgi:hypothetical protein
VVASPTISGMFCFVLILMKSFGLTEEMYCWVIHDHAVLRIFFFYSFVWILFCLNTFLMIRMYLIGWNDYENISPLEKSHATINVYYSIIFCLFMVIPTINRVLEAFLETPYLLKELHGAFGIRLFTWIYLFGYSSTNYLEYPSNLKTIFSSLVSLKSFNQFLAKRMKSEYLFCYFQIERYKRMCESNAVKKSGDSMKISTKNEMAHLIYNRYLELDSVLEIRGNYRMIKLNLDSGDVDLFYPVQCKIMKEFDFLFLKYFESNEYRALEKEIDNIQQENQQILFFQLLSEYSQLWKRHSSTWTMLKELFSKKKKRNDLYEEILDEDIIEKPIPTKKIEIEDESKLITIKESEKLISIKRGKFIEYVESNIPAYLREKLKINQMFGEVKEYGDDGSNIFDFVFQIK